MFRQIAESARLVGRNARSGANPLEDRRENVSTALAGKDAGNDFAAAFDDAENDRLVVLTLLVLAADESLVGLDNAATGAAKAVVAVNVAHVLPDQVAHAPSGLVRHANGALDFLGRHAVARRAEHEHDVEPVAQGRARVLERRPGSRVDLKPAEIALVAAASLYAMEVRELAAFAAFVTLSVARLHQMIEAGFIRRESLLELAKGRKFGFRAHTESYSTSHYMFQGDTSRPIGQRQK